MDATHNENNSNRFQGLTDEMDNYYRSTDNESSTEHVNIVRREKGNCKTKRTKISNEVDEIVEYICGKSEKPMILARMNGRRCNVLLDTGASCNIITKECVEKIKDSVFTGTIDTKRIPNIFCANNEKMKCFGCINIPFGLAGMRTNIRFYVVDNLAQECILGVRTMKRLGLNICLNQDCCYWKNIAIPFEQKISSETSFTRRINSKN